MELVVFNTEEDIIHSTGSFKLDVASMVGKESTFPVSEYTAKPETRVKKKRANINGTEVATREDDLPEVASNVPYKDSFVETDNMLKGAIMQLDMVTSELVGDIAEVRGSKTLRKKYDYLALMHSSLGTLIGSKISAARELNNSIKTSHDLEFKRSKEFKLNEQVDDTRAIMDTYNAFVSTPVSVNPLGYSTPLGPNTMDLTLANAGLMASNIGANPDIGYQSYLNNLKPEQALMLNEGNPDIKQVVVYNQDTYEKSFEIMNTKTGEIMHGLPKRNTAMYMPDTVIDLENRQARNINLDEVYDVVIVGKGEMSQY